jgi:transcriptional regulator with XRE-family HTH domain
MPTSPHPASDGFPAFLRALLAELSRRRGHRITLDVLAEAVGVDSGTVGRWVRGTHRPQQRHADALCEFFRVPRRELGLAVADPAPPPDAAGPSRDARLDAGLDAVEDAIAACRRLDGAGHTRDARAMALGGVARLHGLSRTAHSDVRQRRIALDAAQLYQLAGWLSFDMSDHQATRRYNRRARQAVHEAGSPQLHAWILSGNVSYVEAHLGNVADALDAAYAAQMHAQRSGNDRLVAYAHTISALVHARARDEPASCAALAEAEAVFARAGDDDDPAWITWFDHSELMGHRGTCWLLLGRPAQAISALHHGIAARRGAFVRSRALDLLDLACAHAHPRLGEVDAACRHAADALDLIRGMSSARTLQRLRDFGQSIAPWRDVREVRELSERLQSFLVSVARR